MVNAKFLDNRTNHEEITIKLDLRFFPNYCAGVSPLVFDEMLHLVKFSLCVDFLCTYVLYLVLDLYSVFWIPWLYCIVCMDYGGCQAYM